MSTCLMAGAVALMLTGDAFQLSWTHSVEKTGWQEEWRIEAGHLHLTRAAIKGSGAGMEPGPDAVLKNGWWVWVPDLPPQPQIFIGASGATGAGWQICDPGSSADDCMTIGEQPGPPIRLAPCNDNATAD